MTLSGFERISKHYEILCHLYKHLNLDDQLRLSRVSETLKRVFETAIWKEKYRSLTVISHACFNYVVTNETGINRLRLRPNEFQEFVRCYADRVLELTIINPFLEMEVFQNVSAEDQLDIEQFPKLTSLRVESMIITSEYLELVVKACPLLESLFFDRCVAADDGSLTIGYNLSIDTLAKMKQLKQLRLGHPVWGESVSLVYHELQEALVKLKLESLQLDATIEPNPRGCGAANTKTNADLPLKELYINASLDALKWSQNSSQYLTTFQTLSRLTLENNDYVTNEILSAIAQTCENLEKLKFINTTFKGIVTFPMPRKVTDFSLYRCEGLTFVNLRHLLAQLKISKFDSKHTHYEGKYDNDFRISPLLTTLALDCVYMCKFRTAFGGENLNLKELIWHHSQNCLATHSCPKIDTNGVTTTDDPMALDSHAQLKSLLKLTIPHPMSFLKWPHVTALLKHPSLTDLTVSEGCFRAKPAMTSATPVAGFPTTIIRLTMPIDILEMALDFWMDLFARNDSMKSLCGTFDFCYDYAVFLKKVINHKDLPLSLRKIDVFGYTVDCDDLRRHFDVIMRKLYRGNCEDLLRIILCKSND